MSVNWNNSSSDPYWNYNLERNWNIHDYSSLFMFLELQESRVQSLSSTPVGAFSLEGVLAKFGTLGGMLVSYSC